MRIFLLILVLLTAEWSWAVSHCPETLEVSEQCMEVPCAKALFSQGPLTNEYDAQVQVPATPPIPIAVTMAVCLTHPSGNGCFIRAECSARLINC